MPLKFDDGWVKLTPPFGVKLNLDDFKPLAAILFCQLTHLLEQLER